MSSLATTREMLHSEEPIAMARMLIFSRLKALQVRLTMPGVPRMFSPTTVIMATVGFRVIVHFFARQILREFAP